ncbi:Hypothetical Protein FCC1311_017272 [Hondaea fermentalgiana]|uniref:Uncharacterized protein n=1 Tax=Hondaea fermentalgiana TaxID=2315210 RepID=A0A2R5G6T8_9STRA|nr:Hypothetical Protein FCC1311_017272 [Hondaea fermentalgiana]|eukprot:GBG25508.1 Hypothetical Protein FCC1311_017272 [Hondaea fermentalgiana]
MGDDAASAAAMGRMLAVTSEADGFIINTTHGTFESPIDGSLSDMLFAAAGASSPAGALMLTIFIGSWILQPIALVHTTVFFRVFGVRSDFLGNLLLGVLLPMGIVASTVLVGRDAFVWMKILSLIGASTIFLLIKHVFPPPNRIVQLPILGETRMNVLYSVLGHGVFMVNMVEEFVWELFLLQKKPYNIINGCNGVVLTIMVVMYAKRYGFSVMERYDETTREIRANLSPLFIVAYTLWNIEYNAVYHPEKAMYYVITSLLLPLLAAILGLHDWLEIRVISALHAFILRISPVKISSSVNATLFLGSLGFESEIFRYVFSSTAAFATLAVVVEVVARINRGRKHFDGPFNITSLISVDERHPERYYRDGDERGKSGRIMASDI